MKTYFIIMFGCYTVLAMQAVDINKASQEQIALLPAIGDKLARAIIDYRVKHGPFSHQNQLLNAGCSQKILANISKYIYIDHNHSKADVDVQPIFNIKTPPDFTLLINDIFLAQGLALSDKKSMAKRVRKASWLPKLILGFDMENGETSSENKHKEDSKLDRLGKDMGFMVKLSFDLDKLIFNPNELEVAKLNVKHIEIREEILTKVHEYYFHYIKLFDDMKNPMPKDEAETMLFKMKEIAALLDAMSMKSHFGDIVEHK